jgi:hypothetical protein
VDDVGGARGEEDRLVTVVPPHEIVLVARLTANVEDLTLPRRPSDLDAVHDDLVSDVC